MRSKGRESSAMTGLLHDTANSGGRKTAVRGSEVQKQPPAFVGEPVLLTIVDQGLAYIDRQRQIIVAAAFASHMEDTLPPIDIVKRQVRHFSRTKS